MLFFTLSSETLDPPTKYGTQILGLSMNRKKLQAEKVEKLAK